MVIQGAPGCSRVRQGSNCSSVHGGALYDAVGHAGKLRVRRSAQLYSAACVLQGVLEYSRQRRTPGDRWGTPSTHNGAPRRQRALTIRRRSKFFAWTPATRAFSGSVALDRRELHTPLSMRWDESTYTAGNDREAFLVGKRLPKDMPAVGTSLSAGTVGYAGSTTAHTNAQPRANAPPTSPPCEVWPATPRARARLSGFREEGAL